MEINNIDYKLDILIKFWNDRNIVLGSKNTLNSLRQFEEKKGVEFPKDFIQYFLYTNGMELLYPNEFDSEGFLFYPLNAVVTLEEEFNLKTIDKVEKCLIFAEFMHKSWWYGVRIEKDNKYTIGIIPEQTKFKSITNSLAEFIDLYMSNSTVLYDYK
jgi:hypothetical protein